MVLERIIYRRSSRYVSLRFSRVRQARKECSRFEGSRPNFPSDILPLRKYAQLSPLWSPQRSQNAERDPIRKKGLGVKTVLCDQRRKSLGIEGGWRVHLRLTSCHWGGSGIRERFSRVFPFPLFSRPYKGLGPREPFTRHSWERLQTTPYQNWRLRQFDNAI